jgi:DNA-binding NarL/FixJ family response regulator
MDENGETTRPLRVQVVHGNCLWRDCLAQVLARDQELQVTALDPNRSDSLSLVEQSRPDVILMDGNLPEKRGLDLVHQVRQCLEQTKVLVLLSATDEAQAAEYIVAGAHGFVMDDSSLEELRAAIGRVHNGRAVCSADMIHSLYVHFGKLARESHWRKEVTATDLTAREVEILNLISSHLGNKQIAKRLSVSTYTVKNHVHNILEKLRVHSRAEAVDYARQRQWLREVRCDPQ